MKFAGLDFENIDLKWEDMYSGDFLGPVAGGAAGGGILIAYLAYKKLEYYLLRAIALIAILIVATGGGVIYFLLGKLGYKHTSTEVGEKKDKVRVKTLEDVESLFAAPGTTITHTQFLTKAATISPEYTSIL